MKKPFITKEKLDEILKQYPTPFYLYDEEGIRSTLHRLKKAFSWNPGFQEYFAVKACPNPSILHIMKEEGCGVDTSSYTELLLAERCHFLGKEIMFSSNDTPWEDYEFANKLNATINVDDISHLKPLKKLLGSFPKRMSCRYNPGGVFQLGKTNEGFQVMDIPEESKFGMTKKQLFEAFQYLKDNGVKEFGIHSFLASNTLSNDYYPILAKELFQLAVELKEKIGCSITFINLSGGIGIPYHPEDQKNDIDAIGKGVKQAYEELFIPAGLDHVAIYTELGRFITGPYGALITKVLHIKHTYRDYLGVDANSCNLMRPAMYGAYHHITVLGKEKSPSNHTYDVVGNLCENNDKLAIQRNLPECEIGDFLFIHDTGAHGFSMGYNYNGRLRSAELLLKKDGSVKQIRRAETPEDYFSTITFQG